MTPPKLPPIAPQQAAPEPTPLTSDHLRILADARIRSRKVMRAASVASFSGWSMALFAAITLMFGFSDPVSIALGVGMGASAYNEFRGAAMLRKFDLRGPKRLAIGQLALGALIVAYALWSIGAAFHPAAAQASGDAQVDQMLADMDMGGLIKTLTAAVYGGVALVGIIVPGLTALYYRSRAKPIREFLANTPEWAVQALQT